MTPRALLKAVEQRKAIAGFEHVGGRLPAAFIIGMPFKYVMDRLPHSKIYQPKQRKKK